MKARHAVAVIAAISLAACTGITDVECSTEGVTCGGADRVSIQQGVWGEVLDVEGDAMPGSEPRLRVRPLSRLVYVFEPITEAQLNRSAQQSPYATEVNARVVAITTSDNHGFYEVELEPGTYTVLMKTLRGWYVPIWDELHPVQTVTVVEGNVAQRNLTVWNVSM